VEQVREVVEQRGLAVPVAEGDAVAKSSRRRARLMDSSTRDRTSCSTVAQAQVLMRADDPLHEVGLILGGHRQEDQFWDTTLSNVAAAVGAPDAPVSRVAVCVDKRRQWRRWTNVFQSAAVGSVLYLLGAPGPLGPLPPRLTGLDTHSLRSRYSTSEIILSAPTTACRRR